VKSGIGLGPLPTALGDAEPDLRRTPRVSAFFDFIALERDALKLILTG
jgi:hypothetical protein